MSLVKRMEESGRAVQKQVEQLETLQRKAEVLEIESKRQQNKIRSLGEQKDDRSKSGNEH